jgi:hypothetical protein
LEEVSQQQHRLQGDVMEGAVTAQRLDQAIRQHRTARATATLLHNGQPFANQEVQIAQRNHQFLFGGTWGDQSVALANGELSGEAKAQAEQRNEYFLQLFNLVTLTFYWARFEPQRGHPQTQRILNTARWAPLVLAYVDGGLAALDEQPGDPAIPGGSHSARCL